MKLHHILIVFEIIKLRQIWFFVRGPDGRKNRKDYSNDPTHKKAHHDARQGVEIVRAEALKKKGIKDRISQVSKLLKAKDAEILEDDDVKRYLENKWKKGKGQRGRPKGTLLLFQKLENYFNIIFSHLKKVLTKNYAKFYHVETRFGI